MKRNVKILLIIFAIALLSCLVALSVTASGEDAPTTPTDGYYFQVYDPNGTVTKYTDPEAFDSAIKEAVDGAVITLLWDIEEDDNDGAILVGSAATENDSRKIYLDLNGHYYSFVRKTTSGKTFSFEICDYVELNVYSSKPGGRIYNYKLTNAEKPKALFVLRNTNAALNLGEVTLDNTTYPGDNLSTYSAGLVDIKDNSTNDANIRVNIKGGTYSQNMNSSVALIEHSANEAGASDRIINVEDAKLISTRTNIYGASSGASPTGSVTFKNCLIYSTATNAIGSYHESASLTFDGCRFYGNIGEISDKITLNDCMFASSASYSTNKHLVRTYVKESFDLNSFSCEEDGTVNSGSYTTPTTEKIEIEYIYVTGDDGSYATITWDANEVLGKTLQQEWNVGATPIPPSSLIVAQTDVYKYEFDKAESVTDDATYTLRGYAAFGIKANLNLSDKFTFNIYIPKDIYDSHITGLYINSIEQTNPSEIKIDSEDYYCVSKPVNANEADKSFTLLIKVKGYNGHVIEQSYEFSVSGYIEKVLAGNYGEKAKELAEATKIYISALKCYISANGETESVSYTPNKTGSMTSVNTYVKTARLMFKESIAFRFYSDSTPEIMLLLPASDKDGKIITEQTPIEAGDWNTVTDNSELEGCGKYYIEVILPVKFLNGGVTVTVGENSGSFYLDDYIRYANANFSSETNLINLVNSIGNYAKAALAYADVNSGDQSPRVDFLVNGESIDKIIYDENSLTAAENLRELIEAKTNSELELVPYDEISNANNAIILSLVEPSVDYDARVSVDEDNLLISFSLKSFIDEAANLFIKDFITYADSDIKFETDDVKNYFTDELYYSDFGAVGDGETNDFFNLKAAHDHANVSKRHTVKAESGKKYLINETRVNGTGAVQYISIKTNVDWCGAEIIIDDTDILTTDGTGRSKSNVIEVESDYANITITDSQILNELAGIGEGTKIINLGLDYPALITVYNEDHKVYRRKKSDGQEEGDPQAEIILIDAEGNVDDSTKFMFDYEKVTKVIVHRTDVEPITLKNVTFTTRASGEKTNTEAEAYIKRGLNVSRAGTVVENVKHYVEGEVTINDQKGENDQETGYYGAAYHGFFYATNTNDVLFKNCVLTGRRCYSHSSYDFEAKWVNKIRLEGCIQSNFYLKINEVGTTSPAFTLSYDQSGVPTVTPEEGALSSMSLISGVNGKSKICWGIGGTNYCKNLDCINSVLSRIDAHCGLYDGKAVGTTINCFALVGKGEFLIDNCTWIAADEGEAANSVIYLRDDYGSPWEGTITIKNTVLENYKNENGDVTDFGIVFHKYRNMYFGYDCYFPNVVLDNVEIANAADGAIVDFIYPGCAVIDKDIHLDTYGGENLNPVVPPEYITIKNNKKGYKYDIPDNDFFAKTEIKELESEPTFVTKEEDSPIVDVTVGK